MILRQSFATTSSGASDAGKSLVEIGNDVLHIFDADGNAYDIRTRAGGTLLGIRQLPVRG